MTNSKWILQRLMILGIAGILFVSGITTAQTESQPFTLQGQVVDGVTLKPVSDVKISIRVEVTTSADNKTYNYKMFPIGSQTTDKNGKYIFKNISGDFLGKNDYKFILESEEYLNASYSQMFSKENTNITLDFRLIKPDDELTISGQVFNVVDKAPLSDINLRVTLLDGERKKKHIVECKTDKQGNYQTKISSEYFQSRSQKNFYVEILTEKKYEVVIMESYFGSEGSKLGQKGKNTIDFTQSIRTFYLADLKETAILTGVLVDTSDKPIASVPIALQLGQGEG